MGETPAYFDMPASRTVHKERNKTNQSQVNRCRKKRFTVILSSGKMLSPIQGQETSEETECFKKSCRDSPKEGLE